MGLIVQPSADEQGMLRSLCSAIDIQFQPAMLRYEPVRLLTFVRMNCFIVIS